MQEPPLGKKNPQLRHTVVLARENFEILKALTYYRKFAELKPNATQQQIPNEIFDFYKKHNKSLIEKALDFYNKLKPKEIKELERKLNRNDIALKSFILSNTPFLCDNL